MYVDVPWNILGQIQKFTVCKFLCNSASGDDVDHNLFCGVGRIRVLMLPIRVSFLAKIMVPIHSVIYPFFLWRLCGQTSRIVPRILLVKWVVYLDNLRNPEAATVFRKYDGGHWHIELIHASSLTSVSQTAVKLFMSEGKILSSPSHFSCDAVCRFLGSVLKILGVFEAQYLFATSFIFSELFRSGSRF